MTENSDQNTFRGLIQSPSSIYSAGASEGVRSYTELELQHLVCRPLSKKPNAAIEQFQYSSDEDYDAKLPMIIRSNTRYSYIYVSEAISERVQAADGAMVCLGDFGFGTGMALLEAATTRGWECLQLFGVGFSDLSKQIVSKSTHRTVHDELLTHGVNLIEGSATKLSEMGLPKLDIILANYSLPYINYPHFELVKKMYNQLAIGGFIALNGFNTYYSETNGNGRFDYDPAYYDGLGVNEAWRRYFKALEKIGCFIDVPSNKKPGGEIPESGERTQLAIYKAADIPIPNVIDSIIRPDDKYLVHKQAPSDFSGSGQSRDPSMRQYFDFAIRRSRQR